MARGSAIGRKQQQPPPIKQPADMCARSSVRPGRRSGRQFVANGDHRP
jgi:hypothetical protein